MQSDFDRVILRRGTASEKWDIPRGEGVLPLWVADMDFRAAPAIVDALRRRVEEGVFGYALPPRTWHDSLRRWLHRRHVWKVESNSILDATGVMPAIAATIRAFCVPGDKVIVQTPVYNCLFKAIRNQGCEPLENPLRRVVAKGASTGDFTYEMDFDDLESKASDPRARLFLLCNPQNPVGRAWTEYELRTAGEICLCHGVAVASDEIHADLQMPFSRHVPFSRVSKDFSEASVTFWSASKAFNLAGLQTAAVICEHDATRERIRHLLNVHGTGELNPFGFIAASAAWDKSEEWLDELREYLLGNYRTLVDFIRLRLPMLRVATLEATYLAWVDMTALGFDSAALAARLEREAKVKFSQGAIYGEPQGSAFLRINLACPRNTLMDALERFAKWTEPHLGRCCFMGDNGAVRQV